MSLTWEDFLQYYQSTYFRVVLPHFKQKIVVYFRDVIDHQKYTFFADTENYKSMILRFDSSLVIDFSLPPVRMFDCNGIVYSFHRVPGRQWSRGVCNKNARIICPLNFMGWSMQYWTLPILQSAWDSIQAPSLQAAIEEIRNNNLVVSRTFDTNFWVSNHYEANKDLFWLWYNNQSIGSVNARTQTITIEFTQLIQEFNDLLKKTDQTEWKLG